MTLIVAESGAGSDFAAAVRKLKRGLSAGYELYRGTQIDELATIDTMSKGAIVQLWGLFDGSGYKVQGLTDQTVYSENAGKIIAECGYHRLDLFAQQWGDLWDDFRKATVLQGMPKLGGKPRQVVLLEALKLLNANPVTKYDDTAFFGTHNVDPFDTSNGSTTNIITQPLTSDGWNEVLQQIKTRQAPGSKTTGQNAGRVFMPNGDLSGEDIVIINGHTKVDSTLRKIFDPHSMWATFPNTTSGATETRRVFSAATTQHIAQMSIYGAHPIGGAITNYCYILLKNTEDKPLYVRMPHPPQMDEIEHIKGKHLSRVKAFQTFGIAPANPFSLYIWKFS